mmetsp:Transcript_6354/g.15447  ORF Transcript_6354/g.15447 Transcript_6354/m.15447 type:complete len:271 (-) Transcript_6354:286-1098(-)
MQRRRHIRNHIGFVLPCHSGEVHIQNAEHQHVRRVCHGLLHHGRDPVAIRTSRAARGALSAQTERGIDTLGDLRCGFHEILHVRVKVFDFRKKLFRGRHHFRMALQCAGDNAVPQLLEGRLEIDKKAEVGLGNDPVCGHVDDLREAGKIVLDSTLRLVRIGVGGIAGLFLAGLDAKKLLGCAFLEICGLGNELDESGLVDLRRPDAKRAPAFRPHRLVHVRRKPIHEALEVTGKEPVEMRRGGRNGGQRERCGLLHEGGRGLRAEFFAGG